MKPLVLEGEVYSAHFTSKIDLSEKKLTLPIEKFFQIDTCASKCYITVFSGLFFQYVHKLHLFQDFDQREGSIVGSNLELLAPQSHTTVRLLLENQEFCYFPPYLLNMEGKSSSQMESFLTRCLPIAFTLNDVRSRF